MTDKLISAADVEQILEEARGGWMRPAEALRAVRCAIRELPDATPSPGEHGVTVLSAEDWKRFIDACENPAPPTEALKELVRKYGAALHPQEKR